MTVYADVLVIVNLYIDFFLLWCVKRALGLRAGNGRLLLGALTGAGTSLLMLLPLSNPAALLVGAASAVGVSAAAFAPAPPGMLLREAACFWGASLLLAGFFLFLLRFVAPGHIRVLGSAVYFDLSLPMLFAFTCGAYGVLAVGERLRPRRGEAERSAYLTIETERGSVQVFARADTGNALTEPFSGLPVIVCEATALSPILPPMSPETLPPGFRLIPYESLGGAGVLPAFRPRRVTFKNGGPLDCFVAVSQKPLSAGQFEALFDPDRFPAASLPVGAKRSAKNRR